MTDLAERVYRSILVVRCQAGDPAAFEELVDLYQPRLRYFLANMVGDGYTADDLLQEVWFEVYRGVARLGIGDITSSFPKELVMSPILERDDLRGGQSAARRGLRHGSCQARQGRVGTLNSSRAGRSGVGV